MLLDRDRRGIPYHWDKGSGGKKEPQWRQVLRESDPTDAAYSVRLNNTRPALRVRESCGSRIRPSFTSASCCAQKIEDLSWRRTMELCCKHLDLVEVHTASQRLYCSLYVISPTTYIQSLHYLPFYHFMHTASGTAGV